jgi:NitT/TauT family transport system ATP-binding protein/nitrate/nitrite transport system substrate-binding protein
MGDTIRLGLLRLCDAAPVVLAAADGLFEANGLKIQLLVEPSWANIADKLSYGLLDGAVMLPPLAIATAAGLRGRKTRLIVPMSLSSNGNAVTLAARWGADFAAGGINRVAARTRLRLAVVHMYSTHDLLLRYWLAASGLDPERDVEFTIIPPAEMVSSLAADAIDGFCAGAPWGTVAIHAGLGFTAIHSSAIWQDHPEKCLALRHDVLTRYEAALPILLRTLRQAASRCAAPAERPALATLLAAPEYLDIPAPLLTTALDPATGGPLFGASYPHPAHAAWFAEQLERWHAAPAEVLETAATLYRPDLYLAAGGEAPKGRVETFYEQKKV